MIKVGMMQGRIYPERTDVLQIFPAGRWKDEFDAARGIGFDYVELLFDRAQCSENPLCDHSRVTEVRDAADKAGIALCSLCADYFTKVSLLSGEGLDVLTSLINAAAMLGVQTIVIPFFDANILDSVAALESVLGKMAESIVYAESRSVCLCIESTLCALDMARAIAATNAAVRICYDVGNATAFGYDVAEELRAIRNLLGLVHIKDRKKDEGPNVFLGDGDVDFNGVFATLKAIEYDGLCTLETAIGVDPYQAAVAHHTFFVEQMRDAV